MLDRAGDADRDVEVGRHHFAGLADLEVVGHVAGVHCGARGADGGAQAVRHRLDQREVLAALHPAPARDHDARAGELRAIGLAELVLDEADQALVAGAGDRLDCSTPALGGCCIERRGAHRHHLRGIVALHRGERVARVCRAHEDALGNDFDDVGDLSHVEQGGNPRHDVLAEGRGRGDQVAVALGEADQQRCQVLGDAVLVGRIVCVQDLVDAGGLRSGLGHRPGAGARDQHVDLSAQRAGGGDRIEARPLQLGVVVLGKDQNAHKVALTRSPWRRREASRRALRCPPP